MILSMWELTIIYWSTNITNIIFFTLFFIKIWNYFNDLPNYGNFFLWVEDIFLLACGISRYNLLTCLFLPLYCCLYNAYSNVRIRIWRHVWLNAMCKRSLLFLTGQNNIGLGKIQYRIDSIIMLIILFFICRHK